MFQESPSSTQESANAASKRLASRPTAFAECDLVLLMEGGQVRLLKGPPPGLGGDRSGNGRAGNGT